MRFLLVAFLASACMVSAPEPVRYTVVRGDTLGEIATEHGVTVEQLRAWNDLEGDLIEVDQVLLIHRGQGTAEPEPAARPRARTSGTAAGSASTASTDDETFVLPPEQPCLEPPDADAVAEGDMVGSQGLSPEQVKTAFHAFVPRTTSCLPDGWTGSATVQLDLSIGCNGRVTGVEVFSGGGLPDPVLGCITERFRYAPFPAHDLPRGEQARVPIRYSGTPPP